MKKYKRYKFFIVVSLVVVFIFALITTILRLLIPYLISTFIDRLFNGKSNINIILFFVLITIGLFLISILQKYVLEKLGWKVISVIRKDLLQKLLKQNQEFYTNNSTSNLVEFFEVDIERILNFITLSLPNLLSNFITIFIIIIFFAKFNLFLLVVLAIYFILNYLLINWFTKTNKHKVKDEMDFHEHMSGAYGEWLKLENIPTIYGSSQNFISKFKQLQDKWLLYRIGSNKFYYGSWCIALFLNLVLEVSVLIISGILFFSGNITIGVLYLYNDFCKRVSSPMESLQQHFHYILQFHYSLVRINNLTSELVDQASTGVKIGSINNISCKNLNYSYDNQLLILHNNTFSFEMGETIGINGSSGDGKSTLCKIIMKYIDYDGNQLLINNTKIANINYEEYLKESVYLTNNAFIVNDSILENIRIYNNQISIDDIADKIRENGIVKMLMEHDHNNYSLDTKINIHQLSLCNAQIIAASRLLFIQKSLIIFDEAFSMVPLTEMQIIFNLIRQFNKDAIIILISHDIDQLNVCDRKFKMKSGVLNEL